MTLFFQSHGGKEQAKVSQAGPATRAAPPIPGDIAADEQADFGYFLPPLDAPDNYLPSSPTTVTELDTLGNLMVDQGPRDPAGADSDLPPVFTYWGQFLDHELTARTNAESAITNITTAHPPVVSATVESQMKNARTPRFDLDSVYGGTPIGVIEVLHERATERDVQQLGAATDAQHW